MNANRNHPTKAGFYFGRAKATYGWYSLIIEVAGESPMLRILRAWDRVNDKMVSLNPTDVYFGPEIIIPEVPKEEIEKAL